MHEVPEKRVFEVFLAEAKINMGDARETIERTLTFVAEVLRTAMSLSEQKVHVFA